MPTKKVVSKKSPVKSVRKKTGGAKTTAVPASSEEQKYTLTPRFPSLRAGQGKLIIGLSIVLVLLLAYYTNVFHLFFVGTVNGEQISRLSYIKEMERESGAQAMQTLILQTLVHQEAAKQKVTVTSADIDKEVASLKASLAEQGQSLDNLLKGQGLTQNDLRDQLRDKVVIEKILGKDIKITDKQVDEYMEKNKEQLPQGEDAKKLHASIKDQLYKSQLNEKVQTWLQNLKSKARIETYVSVPQQ